MNHLERAEANIERAKYFIRRAATAKTEDDREMFSSIAKDHESLAREAIAAFEAHQDPSVGPSSGTDSSIQPSMTTAKRLAIGQPSGNGDRSNPYQAMDDVTRSMQPGGVGSGQDISETDNQPGGDAELDDGGAPEGVAADHHRVLASFGYEHEGDGQYSHESGATAMSRTSPDGTPRTTVKGGEFSDSADLAEHLSRIHGETGSPLGDPDEKAARKFIASKGHGPEVTEWTMNQLRDFRSRSNFFRAGSDLTFERFLELNWRFR